MTDREKIAHLLRRFGQGAGTFEMALYEPLGVQGTLDRLLNYDAVDEGWTVQQWQVAFEEGKTEIYLDPPRFAAVWALRMLMSQRPLEQRLSLFWHSNFAVGADKVEFGPSMVDYLETIRRNAAGPFKTLLTEVSHEPAMLKYLDGLNNMKGQTNENFAREVMELFTLGLGHYSEQDVKEAARAFTGWGVRILIYEDGGEHAQAHMRTSIMRNTPMMPFCYSPSLHDDGEKTIFGKTGNFSGDDVLGILADHPQTARHIGKKLFEHFAYAGPSESVIDKMAALFTSTGGNTREILRGLAHLDEFWSDACVRRIVKSPADFVVPILRQMNVRAFLLGMHKGTSPSTPLEKPLRDVAGMLFGLMAGMGMMLFYPPSVKGWDWGTNWISANNMTIRINFGALIFGVNQPDKGLAGYVGQQLLQQKPGSEADAADAFIEMFDGSVIGRKRELLVLAFTKAGGLPSLSKPETASASLSSMATLLFGAPEFQFL